MLTTCACCTTRVALAWFSNVGLPPVAHPQLAELHELIDKRPKRAVAALGGEGDEEEEEEGNESL